MSSTAAAHCLVTSFVLQKLRQSLNVGCSDTADTVLTFLTDTVMRKRPKSKHLENPHVNIYQTICIVPHYELTSSRFGPQHKILDGFICLLVLISRLLCKMWGNSEKCCPDDPRRYSVYGQRAEETG